jgi:hypothetical protein
LMLGDDPADIGDVAAQVSRLSDRSIYHTIDSVETDLSVAAR